jgi:hypothetical protein
MLIQGNGRQIQAFTTSTEEIGGELYSPAALYPGKEFRVRSRCGSCLEYIAPLGVTELRFSVAPVRSFVSTPAEISQLLISLVRSPKPCLYRDMPCVH